MEVKEDPVDFIHVHNFVYYDDVKEYLKLLVNSAASNQYQPHLYWAHGLILDYAEFMQSDYMQQLRIEKKEFHVLILRAVKLEKFVDTYPVPSGGSILLTDVSREDIPTALANWVKQKIK